MGWGSSNPLLHPTLTAQMEKLRLGEGNRRLAVTQLASCLGSAFLPGCLSHTDLGLNPRSTIHLLYSLSFLGCKMNMIRVPCSLHCGGHTWKTQEAEGPVPPGTLPESQGTPQSQQHRLPGHPQNPKAQPSQCTLPRKGRQPCHGYTARPRHTETRTGALCSRASHPTSGSGRAEEVPGLGGGRGREGGRQAAGGGGKSLFSPVVSRPGSPSPSCAPEPLIAASLRAVSPQWAEGEAPSLWLRPGGQGQVGSQAEDQG